MQYFVILMLLAVIIFFLIKRNKKRSLKKKQHDRIFSNLREFYLSVLNRSDSQEPGTVWDEIIRTEKVSTADVKSIAEIVLTSIMHDIINNEISGGSLSPHGYENILQAASKLSVKIDDDSLEKHKRYWVIENQELPIVDAGISLHNGEVCFHHDDCAWLELRTVTKSISYRGLAASIRIAKGIRYRFGNLKTVPVKQDVLFQVDEGKFFITNKRIIFMGSKKNSNIKYSSILAITPYSDGVGIEKDSGKSPILKCSQADIIARILTRLNQIEV